MSTNRSQPPTGFFVAPACWGPGGFWQGYASSNYAAVTGVFNSQSEAIAALWELLDRKRATLEALAGKKP